MSYSDTAFWGLPDPDTQSEFYADVPVKRAIAWVIDGLIIFAMGFLIALFTVGLGFFFFPVLLIGIGFIYRTVTLANRSATLGMRLASIELRTARGERFDLATAALHTLGYQLSMAFILAQMASIVLMLTSSRAQGLTDHVLGTAAVNTAARS
ncbi:MAG: RDD family protein [Maritimibacter sp.]|nr:RDD family protein [Maritimibacter sp.]